MIGWLRGRAREITPTRVLLEANGIGYAVTIPVTVFEKLSASSKMQQEIELYTHFQVSNTAHTLYGFLTPEDKEVFLLLISVSNVGPSSAIRILSSLPTEEIKKVIQERDIARLQHIKGLGKKTAERIVVELSDRMEGGALEELSASMPASSRRADAEAAIQALVSLGFARPEAQKKVYAVIQTTSTSLSVESIVKQILQAQG